MTYKTWWQYDKWDHALELWRGTKFLTGKAEIAAYLNALEAQAARGALADEMAEYLAKVAIPPTGEVTFDVPHWQAWLARYDALKESEEAQ